MSDTKNIIKEFIQNKHHCLVVIEDILNTLLVNFISVLGKNEIAFNHKDLILSILEDISSIWGTRLEKVFTLELHQAKVENLLQGNTSKEQYVYFLNAMFDADNQNIFLNKYSNLKTNLSKFKRFYLLNFTELCERYCADQKELVKSFALDNTPLSLVSYYSLGDFHKKQHAVTLLTLLQNDKKFSVLYKPREVKNDVIFTHIIKWLNTKTDVALKTIKWIDKIEYGWCEYIEKRTCIDINQPEMFYYRFGILIALAYTFNIHDLHYENLIACSDHPMLIDLECFGPEIIEFISLKDYSCNVLKSGLLPQYIIERNAAADVSAFSGGGEECEIPFENSCIENTEEENIRFVRKSGYFTLQNNRCLLLDKPVNPYDYKAKVIEGFMFAYKTILKNRQELLEKFAHKLDNVHVRIVPRPTSVYAKLICESYHPMLLRDDKALSDHFNWLAANPISTTNNENLSYHLHISEIEQINHGDVPLFYIKGKNLYDAYENKLPLEILFDPKSLILKKINSLSKDDLAIQKILISKSIDTYQVNYGKTLLIHNKDIRKENGNNSPILLIEKYISYLLFHCTNKTEFIFPTFKQVSIEKNDKKYWMLSFSNPELYSGSIGIILVLVYSYMCFKNNDYLDKALLGLNSLKRHLNDLKLKEYVDCSLFNGIGGWLYLSIKSRKVILNFDFNLFVEDILTIIQINLEKWLEKHEFDVISGISGLMLVLNLFVDERYFSDKAKNIIFSCQEFFLSKYPNPAELPEKAWNTYTKVPVLGFSHGLSGILYALYTTCYNKQNSKIISWIQQALNYERSKFNSEYQGWVNTFALQKNNNKITRNLYQDDWCHGSLGIGLSRIELKKKGWIDPIVDYEISISILALSKDYEQLPLNLCHGLLGKIDYCLYLHENNLIDEKTLHLLKKSLMDQLNNNKPEDLITELRKEIFTPGIMTGISGIVYILLRLIDPQKVPFLLSLK